MPVSFFMIWFSRTSASARLVSKIDDRASRSASAALATRSCCSDKHHPVTTDRRISAALPFRP